MVASFTSLKFYIAHVHCNSLLCHGKQDQVTDSLTFWHASCELTHRRFLSSMNSKRYTYATWLSHIQHPEDTHDVLMHQLNKASAVKVRVWWLEGNHLNQIDAIRSPLPGHSSKLRMRPLRLGHSVCRTWRLWGKNFPRCCHRMVCRDNRLAKPTFSA